jgi:DNA polymerase III subunit delta'
MSFQNILGHKKALLHLKNLKQTNRIPPGLLFYGPKGIGKCLVAKEFAKSLVCQNDNLENGACDNCPSCQQADKGIHLDITLADFDYQAQLLDDNPEKQQHIKIETVRELCSKSQQKSMSSFWKVFIIDSAETMLPAAANAMLKLLEEPPPQTLWILVSTRKDSLLSTIVSRTQAIEFSPLSAENVREILIKNDIALAKAQELSLVSEGSINRAFEINEILETVESMDKNSPLYAFDISKGLSKQLAVARTESRLLIELLIKDAYSAWKCEEKSLKRKKLKAAIKELFDYKKLIDKNVSPQNVLSTALLEFESLNLNFIGERND